MGAIAIVGPTGIGKTHNIVEHFKHFLLVRHLQDLEDLSPRHQGIIFDDISFQNISHAETVIHLLDNEYHASIRILRKVVKIPPNLIKIFTHNNVNFIYPIIATREQKAAIKRRIKIIECHCVPDVIRVINDEFPTD